ncbi:hypothetical protein Peur_028880 [Populus x canadensis]
MILKWLCSSELPFSLAAPDVGEEEKLAKLQEEALRANYKLCIIDNLIESPYWGFVDTGETSKALKKLSGDGSILPAESIEHKCA